MRITMRVAAMILFVMAADCFGAPAATKSPPSIKVTNGTDMGVVFFVLDGNFMCSVDSEKSCYFSTDCTAFPGSQCMGSVVKPGVHVLKVDWGLGSLTKKVTVDPSKAMPACEFDERMGDATLSFDC